MKVSDFIAKFLFENEVRHVFELSGGMITHILDALNSEGKIAIVTMHHEQAASFAADAYGRIKRVPGVALATSGPGATNLVTGIGSCYFDSSPAVFITGQVNIHEQKGTRKIRQLGFQETDIVSMVKPITKATFKVENADDIPHIFSEAFRIALEGRQGPVLIDIPMNIQRVDIDVNNSDIVKIICKKESHILSAAFFQELERDIINAKSPFILAGRGVAAAASEELLLQFAEKFSIPIITTLLGLDVIPYHHHLRAGFIGSYGNRWANLSIGTCDLMIVIGSRLDIRQTGADVAGFQKNKKIYHIDCEVNEINDRLTGCIPIVSDCKIFLQKTLDFFTNKKFEVRNDWINNINELRNKWKDTEEVKDINGINPNKLIHELSKNSASAVCFLADVGSHQMWTAQSIELAAHQRFLTSGGMGAMGFALPAAIGACFALDKKPVVAIIGDGSFQLNIQELQTIVRNKLPIKIVVINNQSLGMIRQFQDSYFGSRHQSTVWGYDTPDFVKVAKAYGIKSLSVKNEKGLQKAMGKMWLEKDVPFLLEVMIDKNVNVYPKIAFGKPITEMEPYFTPLDMEGT